MNGLGAPRRGFIGIFKPGCSGVFTGDNNSMERSTVRELLRNGTLEIVLEEWSMSVKCSLLSPQREYQYIVRQFPSRIVPTSSSYRIRNDRVILRLRKSGGSGSWAGALRVKGLDQG
ncbi:unnamed protein product [Calicophoron daubneyi]|uniref:Uncharacterized protein n=1 Tax=Calicophoron daubneyi TaxID=300641 RepID=A0AAV2TIW8_CALDB